MSDTAAAKAQGAFETSEAARVIEKAPLFFWNGIRDAEGEKLQPALYHYGDMPAFPCGTVKVFIRAGGGFSAKVCRYFDVESRYSLGARGIIDRGLFYVTPSHPLYPQVKAAADAYRESLRLNAARKAAQAATLAGVAA